MTPGQPLPVRRLPEEGASGRGGEGGHPAPADARLPSVAPAPEETRVAHSPSLPLPRSPEARPGAEAGLWSALGEVMDPEFPISIVELGLVYGVRRQGEVVEVDLTFTATACPCMDFIHEDVRERLLREPGVRAVRIHVVWDPPWTRDRITAAGRATLRRHGVAA